MDAVRHPGGQLPYFTVQEALEAASCVMKGDLNALVRFDIASQCVA